MNPVMSEEYLESLLLDYFNVQGLKSAHDSFIKDAGMQNIMDESYLTQRSQITERILSGEIRQAVSALSDVDSTLLRNIGFHMQKQALLEIIRKGSSMTEALKYAQVQVAPLAKDRPEFISDLENIMSLLLYADISQSPDAQYLSDEHRAKTAQIANSALLRYAKLTDKPKLDRLMKAISWVESTATSLGISIPRLIDFRTLVFEAPDNDNELNLAATEENESDAHLDEEEEDYDENEEDIDDADDEEAAGEEEDDDVINLGAN